MKMPQTLSANLKHVHIAPKHAHFGSNYPKNGVGLAVNWDKN